MALKPETRGGRAASKKPQQHFADLDGKILPFAKKKEYADKRWLDLLVHTHGSYSVPEVKGVVTFFDPANPLGDSLLHADPDNPLCKQCTLHEMGSERPFMGAYGSENPIITIIFDNVSPKEDYRGWVASDGPANIVYELLQKTSHETGIDPKHDVRWLTTTRCAAVCSKKQDYKTRGNWCRYFAVQDLMLHPPKLIMPFGSVALGLLSHKSNANDWGGKILTYRGWPDDWLTDPKFMLDRLNPATGLIDYSGHPIFGKAPDTRIPMYPVQAPGIIYAQKNKDITARWKEQILNGVMLAKQDIQPLKYHRPWFNYTCDPDDIFDALQYLIDNPGTLVAYDTETTGLKPWLGNKITIMMFRWVDSNGDPKSVGFPWDYPESPVLKHIPDLQPQVLKAMCSSVIIGHNLTFDMQFAAANFKLDDRQIEALTDTGKFDTWHMAYTLRQQRGSLGLEALAYTYAQDMAGYEEDFVLLAELHKELLHPAGGKGGHYALCPAEKVQSHLVPYVMGDVEVTYQACEQIQSKLQNAYVYTDVPLAHPTRRGVFRDFSPPPRTWVYENIISPANILLTKMMSRGMHVDPEKLSDFEKVYPAKIAEERQKVMDTIPAVKAWVEHKEATTPTEEGWEFDLEDKSVLKEMLFHSSCLGLPVQRLTKKGKGQFGDRPEDILDMPFEKRYELAAVDKFTLNKLVAEHPEIRPLQDYRKAFKLYTAFVKPLRNHFDDRVDKKRRTGYPHLCPDSRIHASFLLTGTRGGRLCVAGETVLNVAIGSDTNLPVSVAIKDLLKFLGHSLHVKTDKNRWRRIKTVFFKGYEEMFHVRAGNNIGVKATGGHRLKTAKGWKSVRKIKVGDRVQVDLPERDRVPGYSGPCFRAVTAIKPCGSQGVWDIEVEEDHSYVAQGLVHHNSCRDPNMQQLPNDADIKEMFTSRFGKRGCIYCGDLSQIELRLLAAACGDPAMMKAYFENLDLHTLTTSRIFKLDYEMFSKGYMEKLQKEGRSKEAKDLELKRKIGKCVDPSTLISVNGRITRIGDLHPGREADTFYPVKGKRVQVPGGTQEIREFYCNGVQKRVLVVARHGIVACSETHRFLMKDGSLVMAKDLEKGMALAPVVPLESGNDAVSLPVKIFGNSRLSPKTTIEITPDLAYVLGIFYGNGMCDANRIAITAGGKPEYFAWQDCVAESLRKAGFDTVINRTTKISPKHAIEGKFSILNGASGEIVFGSRNVLDLFEQLGAVTSLPSRKRTLAIPDWLLNSNYETKMSFIGGLIDTGGYTSRYGDIRICTKSWRFAQEIGAMLTSVGLRCSFSERWNKDYKRYYFVVGIPKSSAIEIKPYIRNAKKSIGLDRLIFRYKDQGDNVVKLVTAIDDGELVDISINDPFIYLISGISGHNTCNFLTGYGGGAFGLQTTLANSKIYMSVEECETILAQFFDSYPSLKRFLSAYKYFIQQNGVAVSITGRVRVFEEVYSENNEEAAKALRSGCNHLIQATASDMMLVCLRVIEAAMRDRGLESILVSTVHDSLMIDSVKEEAPIVHEIVYTILNNIPEVFELVFGPEYDTSWMLVPFGGDSEFGLNYGNMVKLPEPEVADWDKLFHQIETG